MISYNNADEKNESKETSSTPPYHLQERHNTRSRYADFMPIKLSEPINSIYKVSITARDDGSNIESKAMEYILSRPYQDGSISPQPTNKGEETSLNSSHKSTRSHSTGFKRATQPRKMESITEVINNLVTPKALKKDHLETGQPLRDAELEWIRTRSVVKIIF